MGTFLVPGLMRSRTIADPSNRLRAGLEGAKDIGMAHRSAMLTTGLAEALQYRSLSFVGYSNAMFDPVPSCPGANGPSGHTEPEIEEAIR